MRIRLSILMLAMVTSGCASIIDGSSQPLTFNSSPNGARIYVNGMELGTTPLTMPVKRSKTTMILAKKNGYEDQQLVLQTKTNSWFWGNILLGGFYGSTTDYASDAMLEYSPNMYYITLNPISLMQSNESGFAVERGARTRIEQESLRTERQVRNFILRYHAYLTADISRGQGEYLSSLYTMLQLPERSETLKKIRALSARYQETTSFAEAVLIQYPVDDPNAPSQGQKANRSRR
jgi:PEGA domain-containing protein